ncbi:transmembrane protease serine 5-like [Oculina patagonica]
MLTTQGKITHSKEALVDQCGVKLTKRIVGGQHASPGEWRWHAEIDIEYYWGGLRHVCSGSLLTPQWVITAEHCVYNRRLEEIFVKLGEHTRSKNGGKEQLRSLDHYVLHSYTDLALLKLKTPATINDHVGTICLPESTERLPVGTVLWQTGWGRISHGGRLSDVLKELEVNIVYFAGDDRFYTNATQEGHGTCRGDSGGPVVHERNGRWYLEGVHVTGRDICAEPGSYDGKVATRAFLNWIKDTIKNN